jgi:hypothetical protein
MKKRTNDGYVQVNPTPSGFLVTTLTHEEKIQDHMAVTNDDAYALHELLGRALREKGIHGA